MPKRIGYDSSLHFGVGIDSSSEQARGTGVVKTPPKNLEGARGFTVVYSTHFCEDQRSFEETIGVSAAMSVRYGFVAGGSAKVDFAQSKTMTSHSLCVIVKVLVSNPTLFMEDVRLDEQARSLAAKNPQAFKTRYGDMYVNGILAGGEFFGLIMMQSSSESEKSAISAQLRAQGGFGLTSGDLSVDMQKTVQEASLSTKVDVFVQSSGYVFPKYPQTPGELLSMAQIFPDNVKSTGEGVPYAVDLSEYAFLGDMPEGPNLSDIENRTEVIQYAANLKARAMSDRATCELIFANRDVYPTADIPALELHVRKVNSLLDRLHKVTSECLDDYQKCKYSEADLSLDTIQFPQGVPRPIPTGFDAVVIWPNGRAYFLKGSIYYRVIIDGPNPGVEPGYPAPLFGRWPGLGEVFPIGVDAAVIWPNGKAYFFKGSQYVRYSIGPQPPEGVEPGYPQSVKGNWPGLAEAFPLGVDAAIVLSNGKSYFFKGSQYVEYNTDPAHEGVLPGYPKPIAGDWPGLAEAFPDGIDSAIAWSDGKLYFFRGNQYARFTTNSQGSGVDSGYPKLFAGKLE